jgi:hypothetical protein
MVEIKREIYEQGSMGRKRIKPWTLRRITYVGKSLGWMKGGRHGWMGRWVDGGCSSKQKRMDHTAKFACQVGWAGGIDDDVDVADKERFHLKALVVLLVVSFRWKTALQTWAGEQMAFPSWRRWPSQASDPDEEPQRQSLTLKRQGWNESYSWITGGCWIQWARSLCVSGRQKLYTRPPSIFNRWAMYETK